MRRQHRSIYPGFLAYYTSSRPLYLRSQYPLPETRTRLLDLNARKDVCIRFNRRGELFMAATAHARSTRGSPIIPEVRAQFLEDHGRAVLQGTIGLNPGLRFFLTGFLSIVLLFFLIPGAVVSPAAFLAPPLLFALLGFAYSLARQDFAVIVQRLTEATGQPPVIGTAPSHTSDDAAKIAPR